MTTITLTFKTKDGDTTRDYDLPVIGPDSDVQTTVDLLKIQVKTERQIAIDLDLDLKQIRRELLRRQKDKDYELTEDARAFNDILAIQLNLDTAHYILHKLDPAVTREMTSSLGSEQTARVMMTVFPRPAKKTEDFQEAAQTAASP